MLRLSQAAANELRDILRHSVLAFGERQADIYRAALFNTFDLLERNPGMGRPLAKRPGVRTMVFRAHVIVYRATDTEMLVLRIIDSRRDWRRMLD